MRRANGTGCIRKLSGKRHKPFVALLPAKTDYENGRQVQEVLGTFRTRIEAEEALNKFLKNPTVISDITLHQLYSEWAERHFETISESTRKTYEFGFRFLAELYEVKVTDLNSNNLQKVFDSVKGKSRSTINHVRLIISQLCKEAIRRQLHTIDYSELLIAPKSKTSDEKEAFSLADIRKIYEAIDIVPCAYVPLILIFTGMRINELATCELSFIDIDKRFILHGSKTSAGKNRIIPIPKILMPIIEKLYSENKKYLIERDSDKVSADYIRKHMYYKAIDSISVKRLSPHACRRTYATMLNSKIENKQFITRILGHASFDTTDKFYVVNQSKELVDAVDLLSI